MRGAERIFTGIPFQPSVPESLAIGVSQMTAVLELYLHLQRPITHKSISTCFRKNTRLAPGDFVVWTVPRSKKEKQIFVAIPLLYAFRSRG